MLATLADAPLADPNLVYEPKYDGIRALVTLTPRAGAAPTLAIVSRLGNDKTAQFPELSAALERWGRARTTPIVLDGEIVALDAEGRPTVFQRLQDRIHLSGARDIVRRAAATPIAFVVFDLLRDGAEDLRALPLVERRRRLEAAIAPALGDVVRLAAQARGDGAALLAQAKAEGWEGLVVKDARSPYRAGQRSLEWRKLKLVKRQELVVGGYTEPRRSRTRFGALLLGVPSGRGRLRHVGHVGGGFTEKELERVGRLLAAREVKESPFDGPIVSNERPHWVKPELVVEVKFATWTDEGMLREPVYLGLRDDVPASKVKVEVPAGPAARPARARRAGPAPAPAAVAGADDIRAAIDALAGRGSGRIVLPDGALLDLGNLNKLLWPALGITKADLLRYYVAVSAYLLPVVRDRPLVMKRLPDGVDGPAFYQHRAPEKPPRGVRVVKIPGDDVPSRFVGGSLATLLYMTQLAAISQDPWFSRVDTPLEMDFAAIDLDPMDDAPFSRVRDVARWVNDELDALGVTGYLKTSGASGLHIYLPMRPGTPFEAGMLFCRIVAELVAGRHPAEATVERTVRKRDPSAVYVDYLQNVEGKTLACAYSARASDYAGASTPLARAELDDRLDPRAFTIRTLPARLAEVGDLWAGLHSSPGIDLEAALDRFQTRHGKRKPAPRGS
jgi:bifunctional non-homologous end joining protein LigD